MKKQLLLIILPVLLFTITLQAQTKVWSFAGDNLAGYENMLDTNTKIETLYSGTGGNIGVSGSADSDNTIGSFGEITDKLFYVNDGGGDRLRLETAGITAYNIEDKSFFDAFFGAGALWGRLYSNGSGSDTRRFYGFNLLNGEEITIYYYVDSSDPVETLTIDKPTAADETFDIDNSIEKTGHKVVITATEDGLYKFYCGTGKLSVGRIYEGNIALSLDKNKLAVSTNIKAIGGRIYVSNVKLNTEINIYSITGALIKSFKTNADTDFEFKSGLYIATVKTIEGQKAVKLVTH